MLKNILLTSLLLIFSIAASAKKMILPIEYVAGTADMIVIGEIVSVENGTYQLKVTESIKGNSSTLITVQQFREWTCDVRYAKPAKGQQLFLFLKKIEGKLEIINGSTGELPVIDNKVTLAYEIQRSENNQPRPYQLSITEFKAGIKGFIHLFVLMGENKENRPVYFLQKGKDKDLQLFAKNGNFSKWICEKIQRNYKIVKS